MNSPDKPFFRLFACCLLVKGAKRSLINDVQRNRHFLIPNALGQLLETDVGCTYAEIRAKYGPENEETVIGYFDYLIQNELIFWCNQEELALFTAIPLAYEEPAQITNAIIDIDAQSAHDFGALFNQLDSLGCSHLQVRSYTAKHPDYFSDMLALLENKHVLSVELLTKHDSAWQQEAQTDLFNKYPRLLSLVLHSASPETIEQHKPTEGVFLTEQAITNQSHCGIISPAYFSINLSTFIESQGHNTCLNRKISVDAQGYIRNCPSLPEQYGHSSDTSLIEALNKTAFKERWFIHKDQIEICRDCEFRHICTDCRAYTKDPTNPFAKPAKCSYNPYTATWDSANSTANALHGQ